jgi:Protein of unknown function (DUF1176)
MRTLIALLSLAILAAPSLAASKTVRDWIGTCDDLACFAETTGAGGLAMGGQGYRLQIHRSNDASAAWYVKLVARKVPAPDGTSPVFFFLDDVSVESRLGADATGEGFDVSDQASLEQIFPMLRQGLKANITYTAAEGHQREEFSLSGLAAVLLWIDERQDRVGNSSQVAAIAPVAPGGGAPPGLRDELVALSVVRECQWAVPGEGAETFNVEQHELGDNQTLLVVQCTMGAYQPSTMVFLRAFDRLDQLAFPSYGSDSGWSGTNYLGFVEFDPKTKELSNYAKSRGLGDCGTSSRYRWTGYDFKLLEYRHRDCNDDEPVDPDGEIPEFPIVYEAK